MKKINFLIIALLFSLSCIGQQINLNDTVSIKLPDSAQMLNRDQFADHVKAKFNHSKSALISIPDRAERSDNKHYYKVGNILVNLVHGKRSEKNKDTYLAEQKKGFDAMNNRFHSLENYNSVLKIVNNHPVLITNYVIENVGYYYFSCNDSSNRYTLKGELQFDEADAAEAKILLDEILENIEFKK